ncbi:MAG: alpha/beta fold hydrolase [Rhodospirillaceae bacterium]|jgi:pimeloyl-ACP methyl ester carboxylesterase|nr:alpha/beta fold hydrolase [Rhodospirillaceae bacterium]MBT5192599.1 alpha/beta fold hydrolase [Rhodospirillaceae bacterium]MBT5895789.1 alpha/beta fold hydrolase [Rhodospirillaceae bacterium]MBT6428542.1 alpha/beta fold hydrolase [Rhodospirillaceae bacterium]
MTDHAYQRLPYLVSFEDHSLIKETYAGQLNRITLEGHLLRPDDRPSKTVLIFMHPSGLMHYLPMPLAMARAGHHVMTCGSRYPKNDSALIMEKVALDMGAHIRHAKEAFGYEKIILAGWSGGGSLSMFYQSEAEDPSITQTPAGDPVDVATAGLQPADGVLQLAAHVSRALILTEWLDASIIDEGDPDRRDDELNLYDPKNPNQPTYAAEFLERYIAAQVARNRRITAWVQERLAHLRQHKGPAAEQGFVVHGTMADPRWLDPTIDPNDRKPNWSFMGDPRMVNDAPAGLARFCTLRSWLSQWSYDLSGANGPACAKRISVPALVVGNTADDGCTPSHTNRIYEAIASSDKTKQLIQGATHYYFGQPDKLAAAVATVDGWLKERDFWD